MIFFFWNFKNWRKKGTKTNQNHCFLWKNFEKMEFSQICSPEPHWKPCFLTVATAVAGEWIFVWWFCSYQLVQRQIVVGMPMRWWEGKDQAGWGAGGRRRHTSFRGYAPWPSFCKKRRLIWIFSLQWVEFCWVLAYPRCFEWNFQKKKFQKNIFFFEKFKILGLTTQAKKFKKFSMKMKIDKFKN